MITLTPKEREAVERVQFNRTRAQRRLFGLGAKRLVLDIENEKSLYERYNTGQQYVSGADLVEPGNINCISYGWLDDKAIDVVSIYDTDYESMIREAHDVLSQAEAVIGHNFKKHDRGKLNDAFARLGLNFPEYEVIDTLQLARKAFGQTLPSGNALKDISPYLGLGQPVDRYHLLVDDLEAGKPSAIRRLHRYSKHDIVLTKNLYNFLVEKFTNDATH